MLAEKLLGTVGNATNPVYVEDVFSTYLYTGNSSTQTITNGIDLSTKGGLVWLKSRSSVTDHCLIDTAQGRSKELYSNLTNAADTLSSTNGITAFNTTGFSLGTNWGGENPSGASMVSWTFRKQAKFFDVVTYTGNGVDDRQIAHSLGSEPGCVIIKRTDAGGTDWVMSHNYDFGNVIFLNKTNAAIANPSTNSYFGYPDPPLQTTYFTVGTNAATNANGGTYVAYLFAHNAGGFGATGTDNVISCGQYTGNGSTTGPVINLGYEPQWLLIKRTDTSGYSWNIYDSMRAFNVNYALELFANSSDAEGNYNNVKPTSKGFQPIDTDAAVNASGGKYIYIAIRRGPMKTPTTGTSVFKPITYVANGTDTEYNAGFPIDLAANLETDTANDKFFGDRLTGIRALKTNSIAAQQTWTVPNSFTQNGFTITGAGDWVAHCFGRAPKFFDEVCYAGNSTARTLNHNLTIAPELMIVKSRSNSRPWMIYNAASGPTKYMTFSSGGGGVNTDSTVWNDTLPTSSVFTVGIANEVNATNENFVAYLFGTCPGVSKVGSYTGTGSTQTINCGFTGGARYVLIKRTDSTGNWYVWDTARGMVSGTDPKIPLNLSDAQSQTNWVYTATTGFQLVSSDTNINENGGSYIYLAIA